MSRMEEIEQHCKDAHAAISRGSSTPAIRALCSALMGLCEEIREMKGEELVAPVDEPTAPVEEDEGGLGL